MLLVHDGLKPPRTQGFQGYGSSILRIGYLVPRMNIFCIVSSRLAILRIEGCLNSALLTAFLESPKVLLLLLLLLFLLLLLLLIMILVVIITIMLVIIIVIIINIIVIRLLLLLLIIIIINIIIIHYSNTGLSSQPLAHTCCGILCCGI